MNSCPEFSLLSQFLDHELGETQREEISRHIDLCPKCHGRITTVKDTENTLRVMFAKPTSQLLEASTLDCLSPEQISGYVHETLSARTQAKAEQHLLICDICLTEIHRAFQYSFALASAVQQSVPPALKAQVSSLWNSTYEHEKAPLSRFVIRIAQKGLELLEQHVVAPIRDVEELFIPLPVYRAEEKSPPLSLRIPVDRAEIRATIAGGEHGVELQITLLNAEQEALVGQRIFLRQHGRAVFSAKTDEVGALRTPALNPGIYEVSCPEITVVFQLELRP